MLSRSFRFVSLTKVSFTFAVFALLAITARPTFAAITVTGSVSPSDPSTWTSTEYAYVGYGADGSVSVDGGSGILSYEGYVGYSEGFSGTATVSGTGSTWKNSYELSIGTLGTGAINITSGGSVGNATGYVGKYSGAVGVATVSGLGSAWTTSGTLYVGYYGTGTLNITNGGSVGNATGYIGYYNGSVGTATVSGTGSTWTNSGILIVGGRKGTLSITDGGLVVVASTTGVGTGGNISFNGGTLATKTFQASSGQVSGTGVVNTQGLVSDVTLTFNSTASLKQKIFLNGVTVNLDLASDPDANGVLGVGYAKGKSGSLTISNSVVVNSEQGCLGCNTGASGTATVSGTGSAWTNSANLYVGYEGTGALNITNGGSVSNASGILGMFTASGTFTSSLGMASVQGIGSKWINNGTLDIGHIGTGTLNILDGGFVSSIGTCLVGYSSSSVGSVAVSGIGSTLTCSGTFYIGYSGKGGLNISNGGCVSSSGSCYLGYYQNASGSATVSGTGSIWTHSGILCVGYKSSCSLIISNGGTLNCTQASILGYYDGYTGTATVSGTGATWATSYLSVGLMGTGILNIANGGTVSTVNSAVGDNWHQPYLHSLGVVSINGTGSTWTNSGTLTIGNWGTGTLNQTGGNISTDTLRLGVGYGSLGTYDFTGGVLSVSSLVRGDYGAAFNFGGGTLRLTSATTVALAMTLTGARGAANVDTNGFGVTLSGTLSGAGGLNKVGSGALTLSGTETFTGGVNVRAGKLVLTSTETNVSTLDVDTSSGSTLSITGGSHTLDVISGSGTTVVAGTATLTVACLVQDTLILGGTGESGIASTASEIATVAVPEPAALALLLTACGLAFAARRKVGRGA